MNVLYALSSAVFATVFLVAIMVFGDETARDAAIAASFLACVSQFTAQDEQSFRLSIYTAYAAFVCALFAFIALLMGI